MVSSIDAPARAETVPVLIVGGSLVGLATSLFLSWHGVSSLLIERHPGISPLPRAGGFNARTMEIFHTVGVESAIDQVVPPSTKAGGSLRMESLNGKELAVVAQNIGGNESKLSPVRDRFIPQSLLEPILQTRARELDSNLRFHTELGSFKQDSDGICARIRDSESGEERNIHARYLVAADGNRSTIREQLGIKEHGPGVLGHQVSIFFKADVRKALRGRHIFLCYITNPEVQGVLGVAPDGLSGGLVVSYPPDADVQTDNFSHERAITAVRSAIGQSDLAVEILGTSTWSMAALVAERFQEGNIFLVGDSAHVMPPSGGFGANTGISDAYNLAWKLAFVLKGQAQPALLASYDGERRPVAELTVEQAYVRSLIRLFANPSSDALINEQRDHETVVFGYRYQSCAVFSEANEQFAALLENPHLPSGHPGTRAPHVVLERHGQQLSTLDLFGQHFVLFTDAQGESWQMAVSDVKDALNIALDVYQVGEGADLVDISGDFKNAYGMTTAGGATLVRPDGYIAWRSQQAQAANKLKQVMILLLSRA